MSLAGNPFGGAAVTLAAVSGRGAAIRCAAFGRQLGKRGDHFDLGKTRS